MSYVRRFEAVHININIMGMRIKPINKTIIITLLRMIIRTVVMQAAATCMCRIHRW
jgi:hypothetical protein